MIDKGISYDIPQLAKPKGDGRKRQGYRGDDAYGGGTTAGGDRSNSPGDRGDGPATGTARESQMGMQGKTGKATGVLGSVEDSSVNADLKAQQDANQRAQVRAGQIRAIENLIDRPKIGFTDAATYNLLSPKNILSGLGSLITGVPFVGPIIGELGTKFNDKYGPFNNREFYEQKVKPAGKTNLSFEDYMDARMKGEIDAYGNPTGNMDRGGGNDTSGILQNLLSNSNLFNQPTITSLPSQSLNYAYTPFSNKVVIAPGTALGRGKVTI